MDTRDTMAATLQGNVAVKGCDAKDWQNDLTHDDGDDGTTTD